MKVTIPGYTTLYGNPVTILKLMQSARVFDQLTGDEYIHGVKEAAWRGFGIRLNVTGNTYEERAKSMLKSMAENKLITIEEE